ncbi:MAG: peptidoglycan editing factor PgeF [Chloroflexota bacterium]
MAFSRTDRDGVTFFTVPRFPAGARAVFSTRLGGVSVAPYATLNVGDHVGDAPDAVAENRRRLAAAAGLPESWATAQQVHGCEILRVERAGDGGPLGCADALITDRPGLPLAVFTADCTAVFIYDPVARAIGLAHAGWRGTASGIAGRTVAALTAAYGTRPSDLYAAIAPSIGGCCYEVDQAVTGQMRDYPWLPSVTRPTRPGHWLLDLWAANRLQLQAAGVPAAHITMSGLCTACHTDLFFSHRAEAGRTGRQAAVMMLD